MSTAASIRLDTCKRCGAEARVDVLEGYSNGVPSHQTLCMSCADAAFDMHLSAGLSNGRKRASLSGILIGVGLLLLVGGALADDLTHQRISPGFGPTQLTLLLIGSLFVTIGAILRVDFVALGGTLLVALAAFADFLGRAGSPGIGWRQRTAIFAGAALVALGAMTRRRGAAQGAGSAVN